MNHPSFGRYTPDQIKEAMNKPFGQTKPYLTAQLGGICRYCMKPKADLSKHLKTAKKCQDQYDIDAPSVMDIR